MDEEDINRQRLELALEAAGLDLWENELSSGLVTRRAVKTFIELGYSEEEASGNVDTMFSFVHPDDAGQVKASIDEHLSGKAPQYRCEFRLRARNGDWIWYANYGKLMKRNENDASKTFIGVTFNIHDRKCREEELILINCKLREQNMLLDNMNAMLHSLSTTDPLTRLPNRRLLMNRLQQAMAARTRTGKTGALLYVDLDNFKALNDLFGHDKGDHFLQQVAKRLTLCVREGDTIARIGGDEFVVLLENLSGEPIEAAAQAEAVGEKILAALNEPYQFPSHEYLCSSSIGAVLFNDSMQTVDDLLKQADIAMYQAKKAGRNALRFFDPKMQ